jgi:glycosyltransferase involved in cell wall biosynthesis
MELEPIDVTLVVPCYNVVETLPQALAAIDRLNPSPSRVVCIDDGSTDGTRSVIEANDGVELIAHSDNKGLGSTLNTALNDTTTPGLAKVDADIVIEPDWLEKLCRHCTERQAALVYGRFEDEVTTVADRWRRKHLSSFFPKEPVYNRAINGSNVLCRVDALREIGGWDERYRRAFDDIDLMQRLIRADHTVYYTPDVSVTHIRTDTWSEVLLTSWAYHSDPIFDSDAPGRIRQLPFRLPFHLCDTTERVYSDIGQGDLDLLCISLSCFFSHVRQDFEAVFSDRSAGRSSSR